jgi:hypothetical protein
MDKHCTLVLEPSGLLIDYNSITEGQMVIQHNDPQHNDTQHNILSATPSVIYLIATLSITDSQHYDTQHNLISA